VTGGRRGGRVLCIFGGGDSEKKKLKKNSPRKREKKERKDWREEFAIFRFLSGERKRKEGRSGLPLHLFRPGEEEKSNAWVKKKKGGKSVRKKKGEESHLTQHGRAPGKERRERGDLFYPDQGRKKKSIPYP